MYFSANYFYYEFLFDEIFYLNVVVMNFLNYMFFFEVMVLVIDFFAEAL